MTVQVLYNYRCVQVLKANQMVLLRFFYPLNVVFVLSFYFNRYCKNKINTFEVVRVHDVIFFTETKRSELEFPKIFLAKTSQRSSLDSGLNVLLYIVVTICLLIG